MSSGCLSKYLLNIINGVCHIGMFKRQNLNTGIVLVHLEALLIAVSKSGETVALFQDLVCGERRLIIPTKVSKVIALSTTRITYSAGG